MTWSDAKVVVDLLLLREFRHDAQTAPAVLQLSIEPAARSTRPPGTDD